MTSPMLQTQLGRARRRLFVRILITACNICWAAALLLSAVWFVAQPHVMVYFGLMAPEWLRWAVAGGLFALATVAGAVIALVRSPSPLQVALMMDETFGLRERVTTSLTLDSRSAESPAGRALLDDVNGRVGSLDMGTGFPLIAERSSWSLASKALMVPLTAAALVAVVLFYKPVIVQAKGGLDQEIKPEQVAEVKKNLQDIIKKPVENKPGELPRDKSAAMKKIDEDLEKLINKPAQTKEQLKDLAKNLTGMENELKNREKELAAKSQALQQQLKKLDQMGKEGSKEGPAKELQKAIASGDLDKARQEADDLAKKLQENKLTEKEKQDLTRQIEQMKERLDELKREREENLKKEKDNLAKQLERGEIDKKTAEDMEKQLDKQADAAKDLDDLSEQLKQCQQCMKDGDGQKAGNALKKASDKLKKMDGDSKDLQDLKDKLDDLQKCQNCLGNNMEGGKPVPGAGRRPETKDGSSKSSLSKVDVQMDDKGRKIISDYVPGPAFKKRSSQDIAADVVQSSQDADAAREQQRVDRSAKDIYKGYFENLRKAAEKSVPPTPKP